MFISRSGTRAKKKKKSVHLVLGRVWRKRNPPTLLVERMLV